MALLDVETAPPTCVTTDPTAGTDEVGRDFSELHQVRPRAIAHPGSTAEKDAVQQWYRRVGLSTRTQDTRHTMGGQALLAGGAHLSTPGLRRIPHAAASMALREVITTTAGHGTLLAVESASSTRLFTDGLVSSSDITPLTTCTALIEDVTRLQLTTSDGSLVRLDTDEPQCHSALGSRGAAGGTTQLPVALPQAMPYRHRHAVRAAHHCGVTHPIGSTLAPGEN